MSEPKLIRPAPTPRTGAGEKPPGLAPGRAPVPVKGGPASPSDKPTGKVVHDARGNAVWDWVKETSRIAIESTTRLLRKLEAPELKMEETHDEELRIMPDDGKSAGGGYDPYNQANKGRKPGK
jgi:hypothetical protein